MIKKIIGLLFLLISLNLLAQKNNTSPYSYFGIGDQSSGKTVQEISMGEVSGAFNNSYQLSFTNPASYAFLRLTSYNLAAENKAIKIDDGKSKGNSSNASFSYLALGFPIGKNAGLAFGLKPRTTVGYSLSQEIRNTSGELTTINLFTGEGGINSVFLGFAHKINNNFSIGIEGSYIFGSIENSLLNRRNGVPLATMQTSDANVSGFILKTGAQYQTKINDKLTVKSGLVIETSNNISNKGKMYRYSLVNVPNGVISPRDTTVNNDFNYTFKNPLKTIVSAGVGEENKWYAGIEYEFRDALSFNDGFDQNNTISSYTKSKRISLGGFYTPKFNSVTNYWQRVVYRAGLKHTETGLMVNNNSVNDFGISFGVGLPLSKQLSSLNLGFEFGKRGQVTDGLIKENYFNFRIGLSLTDQWFKKRKIY